MHPTDPVPRRRRGNLVVGAFLLVLLATVLAGAAAWNSRRTAAVLPKVTLALATQLNSALVFVARDQGLFRRAGIDVVDRPFLLGKDALKSLLEGQADLAVVADTPFLFARSGGKDVVALSSISQARRALAIVARRDSQIRKVEDLAGKSVALTMGTNFPYFLDAMLQVNGVDSRTVDLRDLKTEAVLSAFRKGEVDAAVVFQPFLTRLQKEMGDGVTTFFGEDVYAFRFLLVGRPGYVREHPEEVRKVLRALMDANASVHADPQAARLIVGRAVQVDDETMQRLFDPDDYVVTVDQALLIALDDQTRWAMKRGLLPAGPVPNFLEAIDFTNLEAVRRGAVTVVH